MNISFDDNPLMRLYPELDDYYKSFIEGSTLVAVLPVLPKEDPRSQRYYASGNVSAVYMYINDAHYHLTNDVNYKQKRFYLFDCEYKELFGYQTINGSHVVYKKPWYDEKIAEIESKPVVLYFYGCDDSSVGLRFATEEDAFNYLYSLTVFEDVFDNKNLLYVN